MTFPLEKSGMDILFVAIAAQHGLNLFKSDTKQAFLNGDIGEEKIYVRAPDWWPKHVPHGCALQLIIAADEEYVRYSTGRSTMACADIDMDGRAWLHCGEQ